MNKNIAFAIVFVMVTVGLAFGQPNDGDGVLNGTIAITDLQNISVTKVSDLKLPNAVPVLYMVKERKENIQLKDITEKCTINGDEVVPAFPKQVYRPIVNHENHRILRVYSYVYPKDGGERRIEVWYAGGDWMQFGLVYLVTNAGPDKGLIRTYLVKELSTQDPEEGSLAPGIDPFDFPKLESFISADFLAPDGRVKEELFIKVASTSVQK